MNREQLSRARTLQVLAFKKWGHAAQIAMVQEECAELIAAINRRDRSRITDAQLAEEVADVLITVQALVLLLGQKEVESAVDAKLDRLAARLGGTP